MLENTISCFNEECNNENPVVLYAYDDTRIIEREIYDEYTDRVVDVIEDYKSDSVEYVYCDKCEKISVYLEYHCMDNGNTEAGGCDEDIKESLKSLINNYFECKENEKLKDQFNFSLYEELCKKHDIEIKKSVYACNEDDSDDLPF